jgi:hypothetical protein
LADFSVPVSTAAFFERQQVCLHFFIAVPSRARTFKAGWPMMLTKKHITR